MRININKIQTIIYTFVSVLIVGTFVIFGHFLSLLLEAIVMEGTLMISILIYMSISFFVFVTLQNVYKYLSGRFANQKIESLSNEILERVQFKTQGESESMLNAMFFHLEKYRVYEKVFVPTIILTIVKFFVLIIAVATIHVNAAIIMALTAPFIPLFYVLVGLKTEDEAMKQASKYDEIGTLFLNLVRGKDTVKHTHAEDNVMERLKKDNQIYVKETLGILKYAFQSTLMLEFITILGIGLIALEVGLQIIIFESLDFYTAFFVLLLAPEFYNQLKVMGIEFHNGKLSSGHKAQIDRVLNETPPKEYREKTTHYVSLENVNVSYESRVLENVNLTISKPGLYAITGSSGSGKTTLLRTILGLIPPEGGTVKVNSKKIAYLSDQAYFTNTTIYEYISQNEYSESDVLNIIERLKLSDTVQRLKLGIHTPIVNHNVPLSGGEIVRLKLARALIQSSNILVMDEPTEFLDAKTEQILIEYLNELKEEKCIIAVVHRKKMLSIANTHLKISNHTLSEVVK